MKYLKYFLIVLIILLAMGVGYFLSYKCGPQPQNSLLNYIYNLKCKTNESKNQSLEPPQVNQVEQNNLNQKSEENSTSSSNFSNLIYDGIVDNYFVDNSQNIILINNYGQIIKINKGNEEIIGNISNVNYKNISFSNDGSKIAIELENLISVFDTNSKKWKQLENNSFGGVISKNNELFYFVKKESGVDLMKIDLNKENSSSQKIINLNVVDYNIIPKDKDNIFLVSTPSSFVVGSIIQINTKNKEIVNISELPSLNFKWDENANTGLAFYTKESVVFKDGTFGLINNNLKFQALSFLTLPSKCAFKKEIKNETSTNKTSTNQTTENNWEGINLICAIPQDQEGLKYNTFVSNYLMHKLYTEDDVYLINLTDGVMNLIWHDENKNFDMDNVKISGDKIFFINRFDNKLYSLNI
jgi:hypothetical protein